MVADEMDEVMVNGLCYPRAAHCCTKATYARTARNRCWRPGSHIPPPPAWARKPASGWSTRALVHLTHRARDGAKGGGI
jgi:hypothetical protein